MESDITIKDIMELKGFDGSPAVTSKLPSSKPQVYTESEIVQEIQRKASKNENKEPQSGSRFIHLFKKPGNDSTSSTSEDKQSSGLLNDLFSQQQSDMPTMPFSGLMASEVEGRFNQNNNKTSSPDPLTAMTSPHNAQDVYIPKKSTLLADDDDDILSEILRRTSLSDVGNIREDSTNDLYRDLSNKPLSPVGFGLPSFDVHPASKTISSPQHSPKIPTAPPGFSKPQNGTDSPITNNSNCGIPPYNYPNFNSGGMAPPHPMYMGPQGLPIFPPYGMPFPGMMPNMRLPPSQSQPPPPSSASGLNLPTAVLLRRKNASCKL